MTKKRFEAGDKIGPYTIDEFSGENVRGEVFWWVKDEQGQPQLVKEKKILAELRSAELTPAMINNLSSKAYDELRREIGEDEINRIMGRSTAKKFERPPQTELREIAGKWYEAHPQIPRTRANEKLFNKYFAGMTDPTFTSKDFDRALADKFYLVEFNPKAAGIEGHGEGIRGEAAISKLTSAQITQLQKAFPVAVPVDYTKLSEDEILKEVSKNQTADEFIAWTKVADKERGIEQPVPPLIARDRERVWKDFFAIHFDIQPTNELVARIDELLKGRSPINPDSDEPLEVLNQHLDRALVWLRQAGDAVVVAANANRWTAGGSTVQRQGGRTPGYPTLIDDTPVKVTAADINKMDADTYAKNLKNPNFDKAVQALARVSA